MPQTKRNPSRWPSKTRKRTKKAISKRKKITSKINQETTNEEANVIISTPRKELFSISHEFVDKPSTSYEAKERSSSPLLDLQLLEEARISHELKKQTQENLDKHLEDSDTNKKDEFQPDEIQFKSEPIDIHEEPLLNIKTEPSDLDNSNLFAPVKVEPSDTEVQNENVLEPLTTVLLPTIKTEVFFDENEDSDPFK